MVRMLSDLPVEVLELIFHHLGSIDDVHSFGRTCNATHHVINRQSVYTNIMRSVIGRSPQHRYDILLCRMLDMHRGIAYRWNRPIPPTQPSPDPYAPVTYHFFEALIMKLFRECTHCPSKECLPDTRVHEILARYQGLRILEDQWLLRQLVDKDLFQTDTSMNEHAHIRAYWTVVDRDEEFREGERKSRIFEESASYTKFNSDQRGRFHCAIVSVWLLNEIRWFFSQFRYPSPTFILQLQMLDEIKHSILSRSEIGIVDELDRYAVHNFMYYHLLPIHSSFLADRNSSKLPLTYPSQLEKFSYYSVSFLQLFLIAGQAYMQPPDLIDLMVRSRTSHKPPYPLLTIPDTTERYQIPSTAFRFPANVDLTEPFSTHANLVMRQAVSHLNLLGRATIYQSADDPNKIWAIAPRGRPNFDLEDDLSNWLRKKALERFGMWAREDNNTRGRGSLVKPIEDVFHKKWNDIWWECWWWANSEDKAGAKMERWRRVEPVPLEEGDFEEDLNELPDAME